MTRAEIQRVFVGLYRDGIRFVFVQGGEPLVRIDLPEILEDLVAIGLNLTLITNGTLFKPKLVERLADLEVNVSVSLDTLNGANYRSIRGAEQIRRVLKGIDLLASFPHPKFITCIVSEKNRHQVLDVVRFARAGGFIPVVGAYHWDFERYGKVDPALQYQREAAIRVFECILASGLVPRGYFRDYLRDNVRWLGGRSLRRCDVGRYSIAIDAAGSVAPCLALKPAGNLLEETLGEVLAGMDRSAIGQYSDVSACNMLCSRVVGLVLRRPLSAALTPSSLAPLTGWGSRSVQRWCRVQLCGRRRPYRLPRQVKGCRSEASNLFRRKHDYQETM